MLHVDVRASGGPEQLTLVRGPEPRPGPGEVLIAVCAAGVNRPDLLQRQGAYPPPPDASPILGLEVAGRIVACGEGVTTWQVGEAVCALVPGGGYAELALAPADHCLPVPPGWSMVEAAALPEGLFTVWHNVFQRGGLLADEWLLVHGGASGIGTLAIQLAAARGARVLATAGSEERCRLCETLGAELAIPYRQQDFVEQCLRHTDGRGVDLILDMVGGDYIQRNFRAAALDGRIVSIAAQEGARVEVHVGLLMARRLTWTGSMLRPQSVAAKAQMAGELRREVWPLLASGQVRPVIHAVHPLAEVAAAHRQLEAGGVSCKLVLQVADGAEEAVHDH